MAEQVAEHVAGAPSVRLAGLVEGYTGYRYTGFAPGVHLGLPSRHLTIVVSFDEPLEMDLPGGAGVRCERMAALAGGLSASPVRIRHDGNQHGVQLDLTPAGARVLLGVPASELVDDVVALGDVLGRAGASLDDRLASAPSWPERFAILDEVLWQSALAHEADAGLKPEVQQAWDRLVSLEGAVEVSALADELGWSRRHLSAQFRAEVGLSPKVAARVLRFERARWMLARSERPALVDVAVACGFADQAHMTREWRELTGTTPSGWLADEVFPFVQDDLAAFV